MEEEGSRQNCIRAFVTGAKKEVSKSFLSSTQATSVLWIARLRGGLTLSLWMETWYWVEFMTKSKLKRSTFNKIKGTSLPKVLTLNNLGENNGYMYIIM